jgi:tetratricopeptide (TPR) repeat protein
VAAEDRRAVQTYYADNGITAVVEDIVRCDFSRAARRIDTLYRVHGDTLQAAFAQLFCIGLRDLDYGIDTTRVTMERAYARSSRMLDSLQSGDTPAFHGYVTMQGFADAAISSYYLRNGRYIQGVSHGKSAIRLLKKARALHSDAVDPLFFLGLYSYARGELRKRLWWVLFWFPGNKKEGIARLHTCMQRGTLTPTAAGIALVHIYAQEHRFDEARRLLRRLQQRYPRSRFVLWAAARLYTHQDAHERAARVYDSLSSQYARIPRAIRSRIASTYEAARAYRSAGNCVQARQRCRTIEALCRRRAGDFFKEKTQEAQALAEECSRNAQR